jgi:CMP-N,N'-diacetyllegionaminic acid synthase
MTDCPNYSAAAVCLIPARSGSKRLPHKNVMEIEGHPLIAYAIRAAIESEVFDRVVVSTDSAEYAEIAVHYGAEVPFLRPKEFASDTSRDFDWIFHLLSELNRHGSGFEMFSILRPTSPFRQAATIRRAFEQFTKNTELDSLRAVEICSQHPGKMWRVFGDLLVPLLPVQPENAEWYSSPTQSLPEVWVQNACIEFAYTRCIFEHNSIAGKRIGAFRTVFPEGFDLNSETDLMSLKSFVNSGKFTLPNVDVEPFGSRAN